MNVAWTKKSIIPLTWYFDAQPLAAVTSNLHSAHSSTSRDLTLPLMIEGGKQSKTFPFALPFFFLLYIHDLCSSADLHLRSFPDH